MLFSFLPGRCKQHLASSELHYQNEHLTLHRYYYIIMQTDTLKIGAAQLDIEIGDAKANLHKVEQYVTQATSAGCDLIVFPEVVTSGFADFEHLAESAPYPSLQAIRELATNKDVAIASSLLLREGDLLYNRIFIATAEGDLLTQDKRHLFTPGGEAKYVSPASERHIYNFTGWRILLTACYDLRFPVWCRNRNNEYDLIINCANWPQPRRRVWQTLLMARAMENLCYVCGVNRIGTDNDGLHYTGDSAIIDPRGNHIGEATPDEEQFFVATLERAPMDHLRHKFPVWKDADSFTLTY